MDFLLTPCDNLQEIPLGNIDLSWIIDGSYLRDDNGKYCAKCATATSFDVVQVASLPMDTSGQ